jgi:flagellar motor switch protein FliN
MAAVQDSTDRMAAAGEAASAGDALVEIQPAEFPAMNNRAPGGSSRPLSRFYDVKVTVTVELGRTSIPLSEMLKLNEGAVVELNRAIGEPVDLVADGVLLARGEIVVVNECYGFALPKGTAPALPARSPDRRPMPAGVQEAKRPGHDALAKGDGSP